MPYVNVPVPEDLVEEVMQFILRAVARASVQVWDAEAVTEVFHEVDEASRSLLAFVARASTEGGELDAAEAARKLQLTVRETAAIMNELNTLSRDANRPVLLNARIVTERHPNGRTTDKRMLQMDADVAELVRAAEQAELQNVPHPLAGSAP